MGANIKLLVQYDGTGFNGWQVQAGHPDARTVQWELRKAVQKITQESTVVIGAGRTDAGVHARGQVAGFKTCSPIPVEKWPDALNSLLPPDVRVIEAVQVPPIFHAQHSAVKKTYCYYILNTPLPDVFLRNFMLHVPAALSVGRMQEAAQHLMGTQSFKSFCAAGSNVKTFERSVYTAELSASGGRVIFTITADGFLYKMVRSIVGTLLEIGLNKKPSGWMREVLDAQDRKAAGFTAPPHGLVLESVDYNDFS